MAIDIKHIDYPARVQSGNINATAVAKATELAGFRQVNKLTDLYAISDFVLSDSGDNTNNDALMQQWWVQEQGKFYSLINWDDRKQASGWYAVKSISSGSTENRPANPEIGDIYFDTTLGKVVYWDGTKWVDASGKTPVNSYGTTDQRPTLTDKDAGYIYFDTTVNRPVFWNGNTWIDLLLDYKVNNHSLSTNPVLNGTDIKLDGYTIGDNGDDIAPEDTVNVAFGKVSKEIDIERDRATDAENTIINNLNKEIQDRTDAVNKLTTDLSTETQERKDADATLQNNLNTETQERKDADNSITENLNKEISDRENANIALGDRITKETNDRKEGDTNLQNQITDLASSLTGAYVPKGTVDSVEELLAKTPTKAGYVYSMSVECTLNGQTYPKDNNFVCLADKEGGTEESDWDSLGGIGNLTDIYAKIDENKNNISRVESEYKAADTNITTQLNQEVQNRKDADTTIQNNLNTETQNRENADTNLNSKIDKEVSDRTAADKTITDSVTKEITDRTNADTALDNKINTNKTTVDNYTVNGQKISINPVLQGSDLIVHKNYNISGIDDVSILPTDTVYKAIAKLDVKGNSTNSRVDKAEINISGLTDNYNTLKGRLDNINSAYQFVASVDSLDKLKSYPVDNNTQVRNGAVFNVNAAFTLGDKPYPAGTNVAVNATVAAGTAITDAQLDPLGGQVDVSAITGDIDSLRKVVYNNHAQAQISVSPNVIFKGTDTKVIVSWRASLQGLDNPKINYIVKKGDSNFYPDSVTREEFFAEVTSKSDTVNDNTTYNLTATVEGVNLTRSASVTAVYPIYYKSETGDVTALPDGAVQYANPVTSANITVTYNPSSTCYLYIFIPDSMSITTAQFNSASGNSPLPITQQNNITVDGKGTYKVYRSAMRQVAGSYSVTYKA